MVNRRWQEHAEAFARGELPPPSVPTPNNAAREARIAIQKQRRAESQKKREEAVKARQEAKTANQTVKATPETYPCSLRGELAGEVDCGCSGKPIAYVCNHPHTDNWNQDNRVPNKRIPGCGFCTLNVVSVRHKRIIKSDGTELPLTHLSLPACSMCSERAKYSEQPVVEAVQEVQPFVPFTEADQLTIQTRKAICSVCQIQDQCPIYKSAVLTMQLALCPAGFWTTRTNLMPESQYAPTVLGFIPVHSLSESTTQTSNAQSICGGNQSASKSRNRLDWLNVDVDAEVAEVDS